MKDKKIIAVPMTNNCKGCCFNNLDGFMSDCNDKNLQVIDKVEHDCMQEDIIYKEEKDMNKMPELKAGMIVEMKTEYKESSFCVLIPTNNGLSLITQNWCRFGDLEEKKILNIYRNRASNFNALYERNEKYELELIWSKKSDNDIKIEEIQNKMDDLKKELEALKG